MTVSLPGWLSADDRLLWRGTLAPRDAAWWECVNEPLSSGELQRVRNSVLRGRPVANDDWTPPTPPGFGPGILFATARKPVSLSRRQPTSIMISSRLGLNPSESADMSPAIAETLTEWTAADLVERFGPIRLHRIRSHPAPGTATEQDVIDIHDREDRLFELVDGVLVEKAMGTHESVLAVALSALLRDFVKSTKSGFVLGADGMARLAPGLIRIPDVSFVSWDQLPNKIIPTGPMLDFAPQLAVEVLSASNTKREMDQKLVDYFEAGVELVWYVDPRARTVKLHSSPASFIGLEVGQTLAGGAALPGFSVDVKDLFAELETPG